MNEFYHLKMFFKEFYWNRIKPIQRFFYEIYLRARLLFMTEKQKDEYFQKEQKRTIDNINDIVMNMMPLVATGAIVATLGSMEAKKKAKAKENRNETRTQ